MTITIDKLSANADAYLEMVKQDRDVLQDEMLKTWIMEVVLFAEETYNEDSNVLRLLEDVLNSFNSLSLSNVTTVYAIVKAIASQQFEEIE